jgi:hypothetical protein
MAGIATIAVIARILFSEFDNSARKIVAVLALLATLAMF